MKSYIKTQNKYLRYGILAVCAVVSILAATLVLRFAGAGSDTPLPHAPRPAYINNYPKPTITVDSTAAADLKPWLTTTIVPLLKDWYPVVADVIIGPPRATSPVVGAPNNNFPLVGSFTIKASTTFTGYMATDVANRVITFNAAAIRGNKPGAAGAFMHEVTHVVQQNKTGPYWVQEGLADYVRAHVYKDYTAPTSKNATYLNGYMDSAHYINYVQSVSPKFIHDLALYSYRTGTYSYTTATIKTITGVPTETHWKNYDKRTITAISSIRPGNASGKCLELPNYAKANGTRPDIWGCTNGEHHRWVALNKAVSTGGMIQAYYGVKCLQVNTTKTTAAGYIVEYWDCNNSPNQLFVHRADGTIYNPATKRCMRPQANGIIDGTRIEVAACSATATAQKWKFTAPL